MGRLSKENWVALGPLLDAVLEMPPEARSAWMAAQRRSQPYLAAQLADLLEREEAIEQEGFLGQQPQLPEGISTLEGQQLGPYRLERPLGQGGMGAVWLASRVDGRFEGAVAIKFLSLAVAGPGGEARFRREGSVLARLAHPNIARLLDAGVSAVGQPYLVLEHVDGQPIDAWCDSHRLPAEARLRLFQQVVTAVTHAHTNLVVHRDLKPSNILVAADGTVKLLDFGIAKLLEEDGTSRTQLTGSQERLLTFEYAAPEQLAGDPVSTATDVYSLAVVLYELLTGHHPTNSACHTPAEHIRAILDHDPRRLSQAVRPGAGRSLEELQAAALARDTSLDRLQRLYAGDLDNILARALQKNPAQRYPTVAALGDDLDRYLNHQPVHARPVTWSYRARKFVRRNRGSVASAVVVTLALVGAAVVTTLQAREARRQRDAVIRFSKQQQAALAVQDVLASDSRGPGGRELSQLERIQMAKKLLERRYQNEPWLIIEGIINLSGKLTLTGDLKSERSLLYEARGLAIRENLQRERVLIDCVLGKTLAYAGVFDSANAMIEEARRALARPGLGDREVEMWCNEAEALNLIWQGRIDSALPLATRTFNAAMDEDRLVPFDLSSGRSLRATLATALRGVGRTREALKYIYEINAELDSSGLMDTELGPVGLSHLTSALFELGEFAAVDSVTTSYVRKLEALHQDKSVDRQVEFLRGLALLRLGQLDSADTWLDRAVNDTTPDRETGVGVWAPPAMAQLRLEQGRLAEAKRIMPTLPTGTHTRLSTAAWLRARLKWEEGDSAGAIASLETALRELAVPGPRPPPDMGLPHITLGEWHLAKGDARGADSLARIGLDAVGFDSLTLTRSALVGRAELVRARALRKLGDLQGSRAAVDRAHTALLYGYGPGRRWTREAKALQDSLAS